MIARPTRKVKRKAPDTAAADERRKRDFLIANQLRFIVFNSCHNRTENVAITVADRVSAGLTTGCETVFH